MTNLTGLRYNEGKTKWELLPYDALEEIAKVFTYGSQKYSERNWEGGFKWLVLVGCLMRHLSAWMRGESKDPETGLSHLAHAGCNILMLITHELRPLGVDDRPTTSNRETSNGQVNSSEDVEKGKGADNVEVPVRGYDADGHCLTCGRNRGYCTHL